ncbi:MAG: prolyl oligopeptidase family serine peptidase [Carnobacterium sp.]|uniref:prolyl oligopeptidase family serine peptidase n=1 Tax=Carnobacterium sp. TaxID=48221 RepID=UPI002FC93D29
MISIKSVTVAGLPLLEVAPLGKETDELPTVVFYHGWTNHKESSLVNGYELAKRGFRALLPEAHLHGERSAGELLEKDSPEFWDVIAHSLAELPVLKDHYIQMGLSDPNRFGVSGLSMGGITTCAALTQFPWIKAAVVLMGSPSPVSFSKWLLSSKWVEGMNVPFNEADYAKELAALQPISLDAQPEAIAGRPVHFWHGTKDDLVPYQPTFDFYQSIKDQPYAENVSFTTTVGAGHKVPYLASVEMAEFFLKHL